MGIDVCFYNQVILVLDYEMDVFGNSFGCYVFDVDGIKYCLESDDNVVCINKVFFVVVE